jgi:predicted membrane-bound mannosyltransferase
MVMTLIAIALGMLWKPSIFLVNAGVFYAIFTVLYTTFFTNGQGFFTGIVGSLGYWLSQQGVARGTQPWYYYAFLQIPMYEYLPAIGTFLAFIYANRHDLFATFPGLSPYEQFHAEAVRADQAKSEPVTEADSAHEDESTPVVSEEVNTEDAPRKLPVLSLLVYWSIISLIAYSVAGEKMPWITVHIALAMLLAAAWGVGYLIETIPWKKLANRKGALALVLIPVFTIALIETIGVLLSPNKPFSGMELAQLQITSTFLFSFLAAIFSGWGILSLLSNWKAKTFCVWCWSPSLPF